MNPPTKPVILIVDPEADASDTVEQLVARYSRDYTIVADPDVVSASQRMRALAETAERRCADPGRPRLERSHAPRRGPNAAPARTTRAAAQLEREPVVPRGDRGRVRTATSRSASSPSHRARPTSGFTAASPSSGRVVAHPRSALRRSAHRRRRTNGTGVRDVRPAAAPRHAVRLPRRRLRGRRGDPADAQESTPTPLRSSSSKTAARSSIPPTSKSPMRWVHAPAPDPGSTTSSSSAADRPDCRRLCTPSRRDCARRSSNRLPWAVRPEPAR